MYFIYKYSQPEKLSTYAGYWFMARWNNIYNEHLCVICWEIDQLTKMN